MFQIPTASGPLLSGEFFRVFANRTDVTMQDNGVEIRQFGRVYDHRLILRSRLLAAECLS